MQTLARTGKVSAEDKLVRFTRPGLSEEYSVSVDGVRQDFVIESPPLNPPPSAVLSTLRNATADGLRRTGQSSTLNQSAGDMRVELALSGARAEAAAGGARLTMESSGRALAYSRLRVKDSTGRELPARLQVLSADRLAVSVADTNATYPVQIDPTFSDADWVRLDSGLPGANDIVRAIAVDGRGTVYVGGNFTLIGTVMANNVAKWDGSTWSALGGGLTDDPNTSPGVGALAVSGTDLYVGGEFHSAGGVPANEVAKWGGSGWSALGSCVNASVSALAADRAGHLFVGGDFSLAGTNVSAYIAEAILLPSAPTILQSPQTQTLASTPQYCLDVTQPLPPQRYYRAWQTGTPSVIPSLRLLGIAPAITLTGTIGHSVRLDYINQFGPIDAWVTLDTVTLANTSQLYFDTSARRKPDRLYRVVQVP